VNEKNEKEGRTEIVGDKKTGNLTSATGVESSLNVFFRLKISGFMLRTRRKRTNRTAKILPYNLHVVRKISVSVRPAVSVKFACSNRWSTPSRTLPSPLPICRVSSSTSTEKDSMMVHVL
jgi:hypothetical protein